MRHDLKLFARVYFKDWRHVPEVVWVRDLCDLVRLGGHARHRVVEKPQQVTRLLDLLNDIADLAAAVGVASRLALKNHPQLGNPPLEALDLLEMIFGLQNVCLRLVEVRLSRSSIVSDCCVKPIVQIVLQLVDAVGLLVSERLRVGFDDLLAIDVLA